MTAAKRERALVEFIKDRIQKGCPDCEAERVRGQGVCYGYWETERDTLVIVLGQIQKLKQRGSV